MFKGAFEKKRAVRKRGLRAICHAAPPKTSSWGRAVVPATHENRVTPLACVLLVAHHVRGDEALRGTVAQYGVHGGRTYGPAMTGYMNCEYALLRALRASVVLVLGAFGGSLVARGAQFLCQRRDQSAAGIARARSPWPAHCARNCHCLELRSCGEGFGGVMRNRIVGHFYAFSVALTKYVTGDALPVAEILFISNPHPVIPVG